MIPYKGCNKMYLSTDVGKPITNVVMGKTFTANIGQTNRWTDTQKNRMLISSMSF